MLIYIFEQKKCIWSRIFNFEERVCQMQLTPEVGFEACAKLNVNKSHFKRKQRFLTLITQQP